MPLMQWDASLDIGVDNMNHEHQGLLDIMNRLFDMAQSGISGSQVIADVERLEKATIEHFAHEEAFFDGISYPEASTHKMIHRQLLDRLSASAAKIRQDNGVIGRDFFNFLRFWLTAHIKGVDIKYADFSREASQDSAA